MGKLSPDFTHSILIDSGLSCPGGESVEDMCARVDSVVAKVDPMT
jgi:hypothetical protein